VVAFYEVKVRILHFFKLVGVGLRQRPPPPGVGAGGGSETGRKSRMLGKSMSYLRADRRVDNFT
jgi:hypothetical protein